MRVSINEDLGPVYWLSREIDGKDTVVDIEEQEVIRIEKIQEEHDQVTELLGDLYNKINPPLSALERVANNRKIMGR